MNFKDCVLDCINDATVLNAFSQLHSQPVSTELLFKLRLDDPAAIAALTPDEQDVLASFLLFVHRHVWRKFKLAHRRVTRIAINAGDGINVSAKAEAQLVFDDAQSKRISR
jgi:hypothetical protein